MENAPGGRLIIVSGPSGAGKTTVLKKIFETSRRPLTASVSVTTRPPRPGEVDGVDYHFLSREQFAEHRQKGDFLECFEVFGRGYWYGTLRQEVEAGLEAGKWVVLEIDVQGARAVVEQFPDAMTIFIRPRSLQELECRLRGRGTETEESIRRRLDQAEYEISQAGHYCYVVINDDLDRAVREICDILECDNSRK